MYKWSLLILLVVACNPGSASTLYKWTDDRGNTHFSDQPPPAGVSAETIRLTGGQARSAARPSDRVRSIRCRDFRGALVQLRDVDDVDADDPRWLDAKDVARSRIAQWCE